MNKITKLALSAVVAVSALGTTVYAEGETATQNSLKDVELTKETTKSRATTDNLTVDIEAQTSATDGVKIIWEVAETYISATADEVKVDITPYVVYPDGSKVECGKLFKDSEQTFTVTLPSSWTASKAKVTHDITGGFSKEVAVNNRTVTFTVPVGEGYSQFTIKAVADSTAKTNTGKTAVPNTAVK